MALKRQSIKKKTAQGKSKRTKFRNKSKRVCHKNKYCANDGGSNGSN